MHFDPIVGRRFQTADAAPDVIVQDLSPAARNGIEARVSHPRDGVANADFAALGNVHNLRRGEAMAPDLGEAALDGAQQIFIPFDLQVGVQSALHEDPRPAEIERLLDLFEDHFVRVEIPFSVAHRPVERAKAAVFRAEVRVIDVPVDDIGNDAVRMMFTPHRIRFHADADQIVGTEHLYGLLFGEGHLLDFIK